MNEQTNERTNEIVAYPWSRSSSTVFRLNWNSEMLLFVEGGKLENPVKTLRAGTRTNNGLNPQMASTPGIENGPHRWDALSTTPSLLPMTLLKRLSSQHYPHSYTVWTMVFGSLKSPLRFPAQSIIIFG